MGKLTIKMKRKSGYSDSLQEFVHLTTDDWLCTNSTFMEEYHNDPLCDFKYRNQAIMTMLEANKELHNVKKYKHQNPELKILLVSGSLDPTTGGTKGLEDTIATLQKIGYKNIENIVYPNIKNKLFNDFDKERAYYDIIKFYLK